LKEDYSTGDSQHDSQNQQDSQQHPQNHQQHPQNSMISLKEGELSKDWSMSFKLEPPELIDVEKASFQLWYTENELEEGEFKGGPYKFRGWMGGIEFSSKGMDLFYVESYGMIEDKSIERGIHRNKISTLNMREKESERERESIENGNKEIGTDGVRSNASSNKEIPSDTSHIKGNDVVIKIIRTDNNLKIELYKDNTLIDDSFKDYSKWGGKGNMHIGMTSSYEKCPKEKKIKMKEMSAWDRKEGEKYKMMDFQKEMNNFPRYVSSEEVRYAVAQLRHFKTYAEFVLGEEENTLIKMGVNFKDKIREKKIMVDNLVLQEKLRTKLEDKKVLETDEKKMIGISNELDKMARDLEGFLREVKEKNEMSKGAKLKYPLILLLGGIGFIFMIRRLVGYFMFKRLSEKKE